MSMTRLLAETEAPPDAEASARDRIILTSFEGERFYAHTSVLCSVSDMFKRFYHAWTGSADCEYTDLSDCNSRTIRDILRFAYGVDRRHALSGPELTHLVVAGEPLLMDGFRDFVWETVKEFMRKKRLSATEWSELSLALTNFNQPRAVTEIFTPISRNEPMPASALTNAVSG